MIPLPTLELEFRDFALVAILLAILYLITVIEALSAGGTATTGIPLEQRKRAASWGFVGIFATLLAGVAAEASSLDADFLGVPFLCMGHWAYFHWKTSRLLDVEAIVSHFDTAYRQALVGVLKDKAGQRLSVGQLRDLAIQSNVYTAMLNSSTPLFKAAVPISIGEAVTRLLPDEKKTREMLAQLEAEKQLTSDGEGYSWLKG